MIRQTRAAAQREDVHDPASLQLQRHRKRWPSLFGWLALVCGMPGLGVAAATLIATNSSAATDSTVRQMLATQDEIAQIQRDQIARLRAERSRVQKRRATLARAAAQRAARDAARAAARARADRQRRRATAARRPPRPEKIRVHLGATCENPGDPLCGITTRDPLE